jgi:TonB family protein
MLDQLVESKDQENGKKIGILGVILIVMIAAVGAGIMWDLTKLFAEYMKSGMGGDLELTALVAPPPPQEEPKPEPEKEKTEQAVDTRKEYILDTSQSTIIPDKIETTAVKVKTVRQGIDTKLGNTDADSRNAVPNTDGGNLVDTGGLNGTSNVPTTTEDEGPQLVAKPTPKPIPRTVSGGVVNSKATNLVTPNYPAAARAVRAAGAVNVQVTISETGSVISANAVSGHPLLRGAAEAAARASRFSPTLLSGQPVKVTGVIVYNFKGQ